jgi:RNA polymerase sigma-70 factor (ECF subfamily)
VAEPTDAELIRRSLREPSRFEAIFERHYDAVRRYGQRRLGQSDGEEVAAATFELAFAHRGRFDDQSFTSARPWLFGIANNLVRAQVRHAAVEGRHRPISIALPQSEPEPSLDALAAEVLMPKIREALERLTEADRETFLLVAQAELSHAEAAEGLGIPIGTVRSRMNRVRTQLRELLGGLEAINEGDVGEGES